MRESKAELTDRLRREGRFEEFKKRREELKAEGVPASQAWFQAAVEFPPAVDPASNANAPSIDLSPLKDKPGIPVADAAAWVFEHLDCEWVTPADAPSAGAWSLLQWARSSMMARGEFYGKFANKVVMQTQDEQQSSHEVARRSYDRNAREIENLLAQSKSRQSANGSPGSNW